MARRKLRLLPKLRADVLPTLKQGGATPAATQPQARHHAATQPKRVTTPPHSPSASPRRHTAALGCVSTHNHPYSFIP
ncbi:unnamed protein product [Boreogadus saida]